MSAEIFKKIVSGEIPSHTVYEDEHVKAFLDINPKNPGHTLIVPKRACENIFDIALVDLQHITMVAKGLAEVIKDVVGAEGINLIHSAGKAAQQDVFYFHLHVVPRFADDGINIWQHEKSVDSSNLEELAKDIVQAYEDRHTNNS